jgi:uncharacterized protein YjbI with pentapeptide repeats
MMAALPFATNERTGMQRIALLVVALGLVLAPTARAEDTEPVSMVAEINAGEITRILHATAPGERPNFSGKFLAYLDLAELNFKGANLSRSDFYGTDFTAANLTGVDLSQTRLDRSVLIRADLSGANLTGSTIFRPTIYTNMEIALTDAPRFSGANMTGVRVQAELSGSSFRGANLERADFSPLEARSGEGTLSTLRRNVLKSCDFSGASLMDANMTHTLMWFARFTGANVKGAKFIGADLSNTDFAGADVTGADFTNADLDGANFAGAIGLDQVVGWDKALNADRVRK